MELSDKSPDYVIRKLSSRVRTLPDVMSLWQSQFPHPKVRPEDAPASFDFDNEIGLTGTILLMVKGVFNIDDMLYVFGVAYPDPVEDKGGEARWPAQTWVVVQYSLTSYDGIIAIPKSIWDSVWGENRSVA